MLYNSVNKMAKILLTVLVVIALLTLEPTQGSPVKAKKTAKRQTDGAESVSAASDAKIAAAAGSSADSSSSAKHTATVAAVVATPSSGTKLQNFQPFQELLASAFNQGQNMGGMHEMGGITYHNHPPSKIPPPAEAEKTAINAYTNFLPMVPMVMESISGSLGHIFLETLPQVPAFTNMNNMAQVLVSPLSSVTTGMIGNTFEAVDDVMPGIHSLKPVTDTFPGFSNLFNQAITHPQSFMVNPDTLSVPPLGTHGYPGSGGQTSARLVPVAVPNPNGQGGQSIIWVSQPGQNMGGGGYYEQYPYHMPTSDINVEQIMGEGMQRLLGIGAFMGNCPMGTLRLTTGGCQSVMNAG